MLSCQTNTTLTYVIDYTRSENKPIIIQRSEVSTESNSSSILSGFFRKGILMLDKSLEYVEKNYPTSRKK